MLRQKTPLTRKRPLRRTFMKKKPRRRKVTKDGKAYMGWVASLPCSVQNLHCKGRVTVHHCSGHEWRGMGQKASDFDTIPLCEGHHLSGTFSIESMGRRAWEKEHGSQHQHLAKTKQKWKMKGLRDDTANEVHGGQAEVFGPPELL